MLKVLCTRRRMETQAADQFQLEVDWCLARLEEKLETCPPGSRQAMEAEKVMRILTSPKAPMVKKRQAMRNTFGDYRKKIVAMEKKATAAMKKTQFVQPSKDLPEASKFLRHSKASAHHKQPASSESSPRDSACVSPFQEPSDISTSSSASSANHQSGNARTSDSVSNQMQNEGNSCQNVCQERLNDTVAGSEVAMAVDCHSGASQQTVISQSQMSQPSASQTAGSFETGSGDQSGVFDNQTQAPVSSEMDAKGDKTDVSEADAGVKFKFQATQNEFRFDFGAEKLASADDDVPNSYVMRPSGNTFKFNFSSDCEVSGT